MRILKQWESDRRAQKASQQGQYQAILGGRTPECTGLWASNRIRLICFFFTSHWLLNSFVLCLMYSTCYHHVSTNSKCLQHGLCVVFWSNVRYFLQYDFPQPFITLIWTLFQNIKSLGVGYFRYCWTSESPVLSLSVCTPFASVLTCGLGNIEHTSSALYCHFR